MAIHFLRRLVGAKRTPQANRHLGLTLSFVAGATNAGGFLVVHQYTSHMTGIVSAMADDMAVGSLAQVLACLGAIFSFLAGAACSAILINWARRKHLHSEYALSLLLEAVLLLYFGLLGATFSNHNGLFVSYTVMLLCFIMGLQNAINTKISNAEIRTTHVTGLVTDIGIELGRLLYWNVDRGDPARPMVFANRARLKLLLLSLLMFVAGGVSGAVGFKHIGFTSTIPLAIVLIILASVPVLDDLVVQLKAWRARFDRA
jgi:uncharacterized membrane protein YoaK (UPF0700 family)